MVNLIGNVLCVYYSFVIELPRDDVFFDHNTLKLVIQIYDFIVHYLTNCYVQLSIWNYKFGN